MKRIFYSLLLVVSSSLVASAQNYLDSLSYTCTNFVVVSSGYTAGSGYPLSYFKIPQDSNNSYYPDGMHVEFNICNNKTYSISVGSAAFVSFVERDYSTVDNSFTIDENESTTNAIGTLAPGQCIKTNWYIQPPVVFFSSASFDDLFTYMKFRMTTPDGAQTTERYLPLYLTKAISASAGGFTGSTVVSTPTGVGGFWCIDVIHALSGVANGEYATWLPATLDDYVADCFDLVSHEVVDSDYPSCIPIGFQDLRWRNTTGSTCKGQGSGQLWGIKVRYCYKMNCQTVPTNTNYPYTQVLSGNDYKYAIGGSYSFPTSAGSNNVQISKSATPNSNLVLNDIVTYTVTLTNPGSAPLSIDKITDLLPTQLQFLSISGSSQITSAMISSGPASGSTGTLTFIGGTPASGFSPYTTFYIPANSSRTLVYTAKVIDDVAVLATNTANASTGSYTTPDATATVAIGGPLPVELVSFTGKTTHSEKNELLWATASEHNSDYFAVERSADGKTFVEIGRMTAKGNSTEKSYYIFHDLSPITKAYYRLKQVDKDGKFTYSTTLDLRRARPLNSFKVIPNPVTSEGALTLNFTSNKSIEVTAKVFDITGRIVLQKVYEAINGENNLELDVKTLYKGAYFITLDDGSTASTQKFVKI